ncbi:hypothetical protein [Halopseudomonas xiamenensis]|uniref:hypothetical protein n=1 Tax=Halopseudomonas xiamenensis TaxID=157792 RepID=UPI0016245D21|nr:hypothetical protein [Halopseudomonas xiamenensis]
MRKIHSSYQRQQGIAAILILVMLGLALTASMLGSAHYLRASQQQHMVLHAQTAAEARVWTAAEALRLYLEAVAQAGEWESFANSLAIPEQVSMDLDGFVKADIIALNNTPNPQLTARLAAKAAENSPAESAAVLEMVYDIFLNSAPSPAPGPRTGLRLNANLNYTGGGLEIVQGENMADFAVSGSLTVSSGSKAVTSGCAKGDMRYSGGGVEDGARLVSEGLISLQNMTAPNNLMLWAKNISAQQHNGTYSSILAGAFSANVQAAGSVIGTVVTGGQLRSDDKIIPSKTGVAQITLNDGTKYYLQLDAVSVNDDAIITKNDAATRITGSSELPESFSFIYKGVEGGLITLIDATVKEMWGNNISLPDWHYRIDELKAHGNIESNTASIGYVLAGGNWVVKSSDQPTLDNPSKLGGLYTGGSPPVQLATKTPDASPGLPGNPICEVGPDQIVVERYKDEANYVFYFENNKPMLKVQNLKISSTDAPINETYDLSSDDIRYLHGYSFFQCGWWESHCFRNGTASPSKGWSLTGVHSLPPGILWFDGDVAFDGMTQNTQAFYNSILTTGNLTLKSGGGHQTLRAPNFSDPSLSCGGAFYPANLCDRSVSPPEFIVDSEGRKGLPLANSAILIAGDLTASGWTIYGNVSLGQGLKTEGAKVTINGGLSVGGNSFSTINVGAGGLKVDLSNVTQDQIHFPDDSDNDSGTPDSASAEFKWGRYL